MILKDLGLGSSKPSVFYVSANSGRFMYAKRIFRRYFRLIPVSSENCTRCHSLRSKDYYYVDKQAPHSVDIYKLREGTPIPLGFYEFVMDLTPSADLKKAFDLMLNEEFSETGLYMAHYTLNLKFKHLWVYYVEQLPLLNYFSQGLGGLCEIQGQFIKISFPMTFNISTWGTGRLEFSPVHIHIGGAKYDMTYSQDLRMKSLLGTLNVDFREFIQYAALIKEVLLSDECIEFARAKLLNT